MTVMPAGQYIPGNSVIHRLDAGVKIASLILLLAAVIISSTWYGYLVALAVLAVVVKLSRVRLKTTLGAIGSLKLFFIIIFVMNALFYSSEQPLLSWGIISLSHEGIKQGVKVIFNIVYIMILANVLTSTTAPMDMTTGLSSILKPLKLLRIPIEDVAMIISIAIRFIPNLLEDVVMIKKAQTARGARFESKSLRERASSYLPLLIPVFLSAFRRADELSVAMEARGYRNARDRTRKAKEPLKVFDFAALLCSIIICLTQIYFRFYTITGG